MKRYLPNIQAIGSTFQTQAAKIKISLTLAAIVEEFFTSQPHVMLYLCDSANHQQAQRARLFLGHVDILHGDFALKIEGWTK